MDPIRSLEKLEREINENIEQQECHLRSMEQITERLKVNKLEMSSHDSAVKSFNNLKVLRIGEVSERIARESFTDEIQVKAFVAATIDAAQKIYATEVLSLKFKISTIDTENRSLEQELDDHRRWVLGLQRKAQKLIRARPELIAAVEETLEGLTKTTAKLEGRLNHGNKENQSEISHTQPENGIHRPESINTSPQKCTPA